MCSWIQSVTGRTLAKAQCNVPDGDDPFGETIDDGGGCSTGSAVGVGAALALLLCAWVLARRDRMIDVRDLDV